MPKAEDERQPGDPSPSDLGAKEITLLLRRGRPHRGITTESVHLRRVPRSARGGLKK
jgi:hypothetical protein